MKKILAIARAEYLQAVRSKAFLIGLFLMPVLMGGSVVVQVLLIRVAELPGHGPVPLVFLEQPALTAAAEDRSVGEAAGAQELPVILQVHGVPGCVLGLPAMHHLSLHVEEEDGVGGTVERVEVLAGLVEDFGILVAGDHEGDQGDAESDEFHQDE